MYPRVSDFLREVFGWDVALPIQSYGFFVALGFLVGIWILVKEMKRKERQGLMVPSDKKILVGAPAKPRELIISGLIGFIIGYKLLDIVLRYSVFVDDPQGFILSGDGHFLGGLLGAGISIFFSWRDKQKKKLDKPRWETKQVWPHELAGNILVIAGVVGLLGAKIFHNLENWDELVADPWEALLSFSGLSFLGGLLIGGAAIIWYANKKNIGVVHLADAAAVVMPIGYAIGRLGCQVSGDGCWGVYNEAFADPGMIPAAAMELGHVASFSPPSWLGFLPDWLWAYNYPHNIINEGVLIPGCEGSAWANCHVLAAPVFPTPFYETMMMLLVFAVLFSLRKRIRIPGFMFVLYFILAGIERFLIEKIRVNNLYKIGDFEFTQAEAISTFMVVTGIVLIILLLKNKEKWIKKFGNSAAVETVQDEKL
jgi:phosphatidylglycerol:prolipoprotein diacylglycerol transferase